MARWKSRLTAIMARASAAVDGAGEGVLQRPDFDEVGLGAAHGGEARGDAVHQRQRIEVDRHGGKIDRRGDGVAVGQGRHQPLGGEADERLADRRARHGEAARQARLVERLARRDGHLKDVVLQRVVDGLHAGAAAATRRGPRGIGGLARRTSGRGFAGGVGFHGGSGDQLAGRRRLPGNRPVDNSHGNVAGPDDGEQALTGC